MLIFRRIKPQEQNKMDAKMQLNVHKAGMKNLDLDHINRVIRSATVKKFQQHQQKKERILQERIDAQSRQLDTFTDAQIERAEAQIACAISELEESRDVSQTVIHLDMDAFYAAVEMRDDPALRTIPIAVGSNSMLSTSNYAARKFGVRAAMPGFIAKKLCPHLVIVPTNFAKYTHISKQVESILCDYDTHYSMASLDEAYLKVTDVLRSRTNSTHDRIRYTGACRCFLPYDEAALTADSVTTTTKAQCEKCGAERVTVHDTVEFGVSAEELCREIRFRIEQKTGLTASGGIAVNGLLAKVCSDMNKPNGQYYLPPNRNDIICFVERLPIRKVPGIGAVSCAMLKALHVEKCADLRRQLPVVSLLYSELSTQSFLRVCLGIGEAFISGDKHERKSISNERTFSDTSDPRRLIEIAKSLCEALAEEIEQKKLSGKTVTLKMKLDTFEIRTRAASSSTPVSTCAQLYTKVEALLLKELPLSLRLMGVRLSNFVNDEPSTSSDFRRIDRFLTAIPVKDDDNVLDDVCLASCSTNAKEPGDFDTNDTSSDDDILPVAGSETVTDKSNELSGKQETNGGTVLKTTERMVNCPSCDASIQFHAVNSHLDECLTSTEISRCTKNSSSAATVLNKAASNQQGKRTADTSGQQDRVIKMKRIDTFFT